MSKRLEGKLALITGASKGLGAAVAKKFASEGADLILVGRDVASLEEVDDAVQAYGGNSTLVPLDLKKFGAIEELVVQVAGRFQKLDILVGNAAVLGGLGPVADADSKNWQEVFDVNLNANWYLLKGFDPLLKKSPAGRAIFVTSSVAQGIHPYWSAYAISKGSLEMMVKLYAREIEATHKNLKVNLINPGAVRTSMRADAMPGEDPMTLPEPSQVAESFVQLAANDCDHHGQVIQARA